MSIASLATFFFVHWYLILIILYFCLDFTVAVTPKRYQKKPYFGLVLQAFHWVSLHVHFDELGSIKLPVLQIPLRVGSIVPIVPVTRSEDADTTAKIPPTTQS